MVKEREPPRTTSLQPTTSPVTTPSQRHKEFASGPVVFPWPAHGGDNTKFSFERSSNMEPTLPANLIPTSNATLANHGETRRSQSTNIAGPVLQVSRSRHDQPEFGKVSPLRNPLRNTSASIFNIPKPHQPRPEHHRVTTSNSAPNGAQRAGLPPFRQPSATMKQSVQPDVVEIPKPSTLPPKTLAAAPRPVFSTSQNFQSANSFKSPRAVIDLTASEEKGFDLEGANAGNNYNSFDPNNYLDSGQASQNIKALLEGAFEDDDDDKPKTRLRRRKQQDVDMNKLANKLKALEVKEGEVHDGEEEDDGTVDGLMVKLLPHQIDGLAWMMDKEVGERKKNGVLPKGGILADDMGLGKTIQSLSLIMSNPRPQPGSEAAKKLKIADIVIKTTLVVAPLALIKQWESEIKTKVLESQNIKVLVHHGPSRTKRFDDFKKYDVVVTTYQTLTSEHEGSSDSDKGLKIGCFGVHWYRVILDEAHSIKNRNAKMTKATYALRAVFRWCLTGTPMQNNLDELQSLIRFLQIRPYDDLSVWKTQIGQPMKDGRGGLAIKRLQYFLKAFMKRRTKDVLKKDGALNFGKGPTASNGESKSNGFKIVGRKVETVVVEFNDAERQFYDRLAARTERSLENMMGGAKTDYIGALVLLLRLRQTCNHQELIKGSLGKDKDAIPPSSQEDNKTPSMNARPTKHEGGDLDDMADLFGAMSVASKKCDVCQLGLSRAEMDSGAIRCAECERDLETTMHKGSTTRVKHAKSSSKTTKLNQSRQRVLSRRVIDSDDEADEEKSTIERSRNYSDLGIDDEDAEGDGDTLGAEDSDTDDDDRIPARRLVRIDRRAPDHESSEQDESDGTSDSDAGYNNKSIPTQTHVPSSKIRRLIKILDEESETHKFIVFSEFTSMLDLIEPFLLQHGFRFTRYDGSMKNDDREVSLSRLRDDPKTRILLCSLRCGSLGLNLTAASRVVIMEPFWNPFVEEQAIDRVHRLNQTQDVHVYRLTVANTVEERILTLQEKKRELSKAAIDGGKAGTKLSMQDILQLFRPNAQHHGDPHVERIVSSSAGLLTSPTRTIQAPPVSNITREREKAKFKIPASLQSQYDAAYGRRW